MEAGSDMSEPNSPEGNSPHDSDNQDDEPIEVAKTFDATDGHEEATVQTENTEIGRTYHPLRHPGETSHPYMNTLYYRPNLDWRPPSYPFHSNWQNHYPTRPYLPLPPPLAHRERDTFPPYVARPPHAHRPEHSHHQQQSNLAEDPLSPPAYGPSLPHQAHFFGVPRQLKWSAASPHGSHHFPRDYSYHPSQTIPQQEHSDTSHGNQTPKSQHDDHGSTEFSGRRFIPTDIPPPPALYSSPQEEPAISPPAPSPRPPTQAPALPSTPVPNALSIRKIKALHPGSKGIYIWETFDADILCGRGVPTRHQWGNKHFKQLVNERQVEYIACHRNHKSRLSNEIINIIRSFNGRFLRRVKVPDRQERFAWVELSDQRAYEKVCQALRDGGPRIREAIEAMKANERVPRSHVDKENVANGPHDK